MRYLLSRSFLIALILILVPSPASANVGIPIIAFGLPGMVILLIPIILIEGTIYRRHLNHELIRVGKAVSAANVFTTFLGYPLSWLFLLIGQWILTILSVTIAKATGASSWGKFFTPVIMAAWLPPFKWFEDWMLPVAVMVNLVPAYFVSVGFETWILTKFFSEEPKERLRSLCHRANMASYLLLFMILIYWFVRIVYFSK